MYRALRPRFHQLLGRWPLATLLLAIALAQPVTAQESASAPAAAAADKVEIPKHLPNHMPTLKVLSLQAFQNGQYADFVRVLEHARKLRPDDPQLMAQLIVGYAQLDNKPAAYTLMIDMQRQGLAFDFDSIPQTEPIRGTEVYDHISKLLKDAAKPYGFADTAFTLPADLAMPEALAWDAKHEQFLVGTVREGKILRLTRAGQPASEPAPFNTEGLWSIFDLAVDSERNLLWATSTAVGQWLGYNNTDYGRSALVAFDLDTGAQKHSYTIALDGRPHGMGNLALAADGSVFVADSRQPMVHVLRPGSDKLQQLFVTRELFNLRGMAYSDEHRLLYVMDREQGIAMWSDEDEQLYRLTKPDTLNLSGSEGLNLWNNHLLIIQNGIDPSRVVQVRLGEDGRSIVNDTPLLAALEVFDGPSYGTVVGNHLFFMAANHWPSFDIEGNRLPGTRLNPVPVLKLPLAPLEEQRLQPNRAKFKVGGGQPAGDGKATQEPPGTTLDDNQGGNQ